VRVATRHIESDPLGALRAELVGAARRQAVRRSRRRRVVAAATALLTLLAATAGAAALSEFSTGVPTIDRLLDVEGGSLVGEPGPGGATEPLSVPTNDGTAQALAYLSRDGTICHVEAEAHPRIDGAVRGGGGGCYQAADLAAKLDREGIVWSASTLGPDRRVFSGYADGDVDRIRVLDDPQAADVQLTKPWTPKMPDAEALRFFVIVDERDIDVGDDGLQPDELHLVQAEFPPIEATYSDGHRIEIRAD
jgi:hypothetical protein